MHHAMFGCVCVFIVYVKSNRTGWPFKFYFVYLFLCLLLNMATLTWISVNSL